MQRWEQQRVLKKARKKAMREMIEEGYSSKTAKRLIRNTLKHIQTNTEELSQEAQED
jgi:hypothetical protein